MKIELKLNCFSRCKISPLEQTRQLKCRRSTVHWFSY